MEQIFMISDIWVFFGESVKKFQVSLKYEKINGYFTWRSTHIYDEYISLSSSSNKNSIRQSL